MESSQKVTPPVKKIDSDFVAIPYSELNTIQQAYVDYKALGGLITTDDGIRKMTVDELAGMLAVDRRTVYRNRDAVPNFWDLVAERRKELVPRERLAKMNEIWYLKAMGNGPSSFQYFQLWQANFNPDFRMPTEKHQVEIGNGMADLVNKMRKKISSENTIHDIKAEE